MLYVSARYIVWNKIDLTNTVLVTKNWEGGVIRTAYNSHKTECPAAVLEYSQNTVYTILYLYRIHNLLVKSTTHETR